MGFYQSVKGYVGRRKYQKLDGEGGGGGGRSRRRLRIARMGSRRRRIWRLRRLPKLRLRWFNPKRFLMKLRDAYVRMMLNMSDSRVFSSEMVGSGYLSYGIGVGNPFGQRSANDYDEKMLVEIYKSLMIQGRLRELEMQA